MKKLTIVSIAVAGLVLSAATSKAQLTPLTQGGFTVLGPGSTIAAPGGSALDTVTSGISIGGDLGTLVTSVYAGDALTAGAGETFLYTITMTAGDLGGMSANGFSGIVGVGSSYPLVTTATYDASGNVDFGLLPTSDAVTTVTFEVATSQTTYAGGLIAYKDSLSENVESLVPTAVPEASTIMAGALMILPLGFGAFRVLRKERMA
jgi:hypothetical protein